MKHTYFLFFFIVSFGTISAEKKPESALVKVEIQYLCEDAHEVFLAWGINGWQQQDKSLWPEGTYSKDNLLYTPMKAKNGKFVVLFKAKPNTIFDYTFWITKGPRDMAANIWDVNTAPQKDYHSLAMNDHITVIKSKINVRPNEQLSILNFSWPLFVIVLIIASALLAIKKYRFKNLTLNPGPGKTIIGYSILLLIVLFIIRASVAKMGWDLYYNTSENLSRLFWLGFYDYLYVAVITIIFITLLFVFRKSLRAQNIIKHVFTGICLVSLLAALLNIRIVEMLGKPFNFRWFYYSGFLKSTDSHAALSSNISTSYILNIITVCLATIIAAVLFIYATEFILQKFKFKKILLAILICFNLGYVITAQKFLPGYKANYDNLANPVTAFLESVNPFASDPELYTMEIPDSLKFVAKKKETHRSNESLPEGIKNVVVVVLESTPAEYVQPYDTKYKITPELEKHLSHAVVFDNVYAHAPATNKSMVCLLGSVYPWLSYHSITYEHPEINIPTISSELQKQGYRTAFFNSGDNHFQKTGEFLGKHNFEELQDCNSVECNKQFIDEVKAEPLNGLDDECSGDALLSWIKREKSKPFFAVIWTYQTHYPYYVTGEEKNYSGDPVFNRYLNAVNHSDYVLGEIITGLEQAGLFESTLVVVIGDHGEAFGRHDQTTHASKIYEENLHIPCVFINPSFKGERKTGLGGMIDIAPTIMLTLGYAPAEKWQGESLFSNSTNKRAYFFCPWSDYLFGYREGNKKYIFNATKNTTEIYDLEKDPYETNNIVTSEEEKLCHQKLAAWVQYQDRYMNAAISGNLKK